jgi:hypothetical protein
MNATDTNTTTTWRDLEGLTPGQREELGSYETSLTAAGGPNTAAALLHCAERLAAENAAAIRFADLPAPADCTTEPDGWMQWETDLFARNYTGTVRSVINHGDGPADDREATVEVYGSQYSSGQVERFLYVKGPGIEAMDSAAARGLAQALLDAADELDRLNGDAPPFI